MVWKSTFAGCALLVVFLLHVISLQAAERVIHDNFASGDFDPAVWAPCPRPENTLEVMKDEASGFNVAKLTVRPFLSSNPFALTLTKRDCLGENPKDDGYERAEIWESNKVRLKFGSDVWYGFDMYIDNSISKDEPRLVIGQWKGPRDDSPMLSQRFHRHTFTITIEQPNMAPGHNPKDTQCRIIIAHDSNLGDDDDGDLPHDFGLFDVVNRSHGVNLMVGSVGHDAADLIHEPKPCRTNVDVKPTNLLPDAFGHWVRMVYHLKVAGDRKGLVEVWANNAPIVTVHGRIGFPGPTSETQYFKFGPYRNKHSLPPIYSTLANYRRGPTKRDVR